LVKKEYFRVDLYCKAHDLLKEGSANENKNNIVSNKDKEIEVVKLDEASDIEMNKHKEKNIIKENENNNNHIGNCFFLNKNFILFYLIFIKINNN